MGFPLYLPRFQSNTSPNSVSSLSNLSPWMAWMPVTPKPRGLNHSMPNRLDLLLSTMVSCNCPQKSLNFTCIVALPNTGISFPWKSFNVILWGCNCFFFPIVGMSPFMVRQDMMVKNHPVSSSMMQGDLSMWTVIWNLSASHALECPTVVWWIPLASWYCSSLRLFVWNPGLGAICLIGKTGSASLRYVSLLLAQLADGLFKFANQPGMIPHTADTPGRS